MSTTSVGHVENGVLVGHDGHLFLAAGSHHVLDTVSGKRKIASGSIEIFNRNIVERREYAHECLYRHIIFPDKQSVLSEQFPVDQPVRLGEEYLAECPNLTDTIVYPRKILRRLGVVGYQRTDTHLSDHGLLTVAVELTSTLMGKSQPDCLATLISKVKVERQVTGDLGSKLSPSVESLENFVQLDWPIIEFHNKVPGGNNGIVDIYISGDSLYTGRLLLFGDSFGRSFCRLLTYFYREVLFLRTPYFHPEVFDQFSPDILITENVERYLDSCSPDTDRPSFFMYPYLAGIRYEPDRDFVAAFSAMLSYPRRPYQSFMERILALQL